MGAATTMKLVLCLFLAAFAAAAFAEVSELPTDAINQDFVEDNSPTAPEDADMELIEASFNEAKSTIASLMEAGKNDAACKDLASASKKQVTDSVPRRRRLSMACRTAPSARTRVLISSPPPRATSRRPRLPSLTPRTRSTPPRPSRSTSVTWL